MAQQHLNVGTTANDGTGDTLRASQQKAESNFNELYARPDFTDAPSDGNIYGRKDGTWEEVTGGSGTTPTLNEVILQGDEILNTAGNLKIVLDKEDNGMFLYELVSSVWEERGYYNSQGFTLGGFGGNPTFDLNIYTGTLTIYQGADTIQFSPTSATKNGVEFATIADIPITPTDVGALAIDGSNANVDVDLGAFGIRGGEVVTQTNGTTKKMTLKSTNVNTDHTAEWQDKDYTAIADVQDITDALATFKTTEFLDATSSIQTQLDSKQSLLTYIPYKFVQTSQTAHTGTTSKTIVATATITANSFSVSDVAKAIFGINKPATTSAYTIRLDINTSNTLSGATTIATFTGSATAQVAVMTRKYSLFGGDLYGYPFTTSQLSDSAALLAGTLGSTAFDTTNTIYMFWTIQLVNSADSVTPNLATLSN